MSVFALSFTTWRTASDWLAIEAPPLARIEEMLVSQVTPLGEQDFRIRESQAGDGDFVLVSPDVATCAGRYGYAFTNCTNCGPRYTIIRDIPYGRPNTTMAAFQMCPACQAEYDDPADRRFHAQPNACPQCGNRRTAAPTQAA